MIFFAVTSEHRCRLTAHLPVDRQPSRASQCSKILYFRRGFDGSKVVLTGQRPTKPMSLPARL